MKIVVICWLHTSMKITFCVWAVNRLTFTQLLSYMFSGKNFEFPHNTIK